MTQLNSTGEVIDALGGTFAVARRARVDPKLVSYYRASKIFPAKTFIWFQAEIQEHNRTNGTDYTAPLELWGMWPRPEVAELALMSA